MSVLGEQLRRERTRRGMRQQEAAALFGVSQPSYHRWEAGTNHPDAQFFRLLAEFLGCTIDEVWSMVFREEPPASLGQIKTQVDELRAQIAELRAAIADLSAV